MSSNLFSPRKFMEDLIHRWWVIFLAIALGGLLGTALSTLNPPRYQAEARISTSIDYTILPELEDYEEDRIINESGWVMLSDMVLREVQKRAAGEGVNVAFAEILERFSADRIDDLWALRVVGDDPREVSQLANIWAGVSYQHLADAHANALQASAVRSAFAALENCEQAEAPDAIALCQSTDTQSLQAELDILTAELDEALALSQGLNPASNYTINSYAEVPSLPSYQARGIMAFLGMLIGLVSGLVVLWFTGKKEY